MASSSWHGSAAALFDGAEGGESLDALRVALLDAFNFVDLVADEFEEAGHDLAQRRVEGGVGDVGLELGALVGPLIIRRESRWESRPWESQAAWSSVYIRRWRSRYSTMVSMGSSRAAVACSIMVPYWPMSVMRHSIWRAIARASS
jgi:hypothetical protein